MMKSSLAAAVLLACGAACLAPRLTAQEPPPPKRPPNILILLADDLGYGDVRCNNPERGKIPTPHIDRLAAEGMRFTDAHSSSGVCSPSRYTLLTGRYHWRSRLQSGIVSVWEQPLIAPGRLTVARLAKQHGYRTACVGKWHLGWDWGIAPQDRPLFQNFKDPTVTDAHRAAWKKVFSQPLGGGPLGAGFDSYFGTDVPNWPPYCFIENNRTVGIPDRLLPPEMLRNHLGSLQGPALAAWSFEPILPSLTERACAFVTDSAKRPEPFLLYLPFTTPHTPLVPNSDWKGKSGLENRAADLIMETDAAVGKVLAAIEAAGVAANTLVLFSSDNGFAPYVGAKELEARGHFPSGPLRGYKADAWEGGHRVPFLIRWPGTVTAGRVCHQLVHHADVLATLADILGAKLPADAGEDSFSLMPLLRGANEPIRRHAISQSSGGVFALRGGPWKFIAAPGGGGSWSKESAKPDNTSPSQLYQLDQDLAETDNRFAKEPQRAEEMQKLLEELVTDGRSTPGAPQTNDVPVRIRKQAKKTPTAKRP